MRRKQTSGSLRRSMRVSWVGLYVLYLCEHLVGSRCWGTVSGERSGGGGNGPCVGGRVEGRGVEGGRV